MKQLILISLLLVLIVSCRNKSSDENLSVDEKQTIPTVSPKVSDKNTESTVSIDTLNVTNTVEELQKPSATDEIKESISVKNATENTKKDQIESNTKEITNGGNEKETVSTSTDVDHSQWSMLLRKYVSSSGNVNYKGFLADKSLLEAYLKQLSAEIPDSNWSKNAKLAYWINVYNAFTVKLIIDNYPIKSIKNISNPWGKKFIELGGNSYSLEQVENEILRKMNEPRIHFAINCASYSCPNLANQAYTANTMEKQLVDASRKFINDASKNSITENEIKVSEIFNWFSKDFKTATTSVIDFLNKYSDTKINSEATISYLDYNWSLNE